MTAHIVGAAQNSEPPLASRSIVKFSPQHLLFRNDIKAGLERFNKKYSQSIALFLTGTWTGNGEKQNYLNLHKHSALAAEFQYRKYFKPMKEHRAMYVLTFIQGSHHAEHLRGYYFSAEPGTGARSFNLGHDLKRDTNNGALGIGLGIQKKILEVIVIDAFAGAGFQFSDVTTTGLMPGSGEMPGNSPVFAFSGINDPGYKGVLPKIGINIGFCL
jgi:hypothetical protein